MYHRVPGVKRMLLRKAFPSVCLLDELFGDLLPPHFSGSLPDLVPLLPGTPPWALPPPQGAPSLCSPLPTFLSFGNFQHFLESGGMLLFSTPKAQIVRSRKRRQCSFTQFYYFLPSVPIPKAEDYFQMRPAANPIITWILGPTTQDCGLGISVPPRDHVWVKF